MVFHNRPFKKDLTPFAKGGQVVKHVGKGAKEQSTRGGMSSLTGGDPVSRSMNNYAKPPAADFSGGGLGGPPTDQPPPSPVPMGTRPPAAPTANMPSDIGGEPDQDDAA